MKKITVLSCFFLTFSRIASAQPSSGEGFFEKYLPIAQLFDSPLFFNMVVGSAILLLIFTYLFLQYAKKQEKKAEQWSKGKSAETLVELLESPVSQESRLAYIQLVQHGEEKEIDCILKALKEQRRQGKINPALIYLLEGMEAHKAVSLLQLIAREQCEVSDLAQRAVDYLLAIQEEENEKAEPAKTA
ncbi:MAG: hypothetical protein JXR73_23105 [Candidatus Omnitrophica bacterium]|nr:hypothetical protein [Candidatus Omnitrophota bacterium]